MLIGCHVSMRSRVFYRQSGLTGQKVLGGKDVEMCRKMKALHQRAVKVGYGIVFRFEPKAQE